MAEMYKETGNSLRVKIAAPTGKAAARVVESIRQAKGSLNIDSVLLRQIPEEAFTIHRLLGSQPDSPYFRHNATNKLDADVVVLDEASMVDLPLMAKLLEALPLNCRLLLVGDRDQLASVEPGRVYGDICEAAEWNKTLGNCLTELTYSRRFKAGSSIGILSKMVREQVPEIWREMQNLQNGDLQLCNVANGFGEDFIDFAVKGYRRFCNSIDPANALAAADEFRVLCAVRHGPFGVIAINRILQQCLLDAHSVLSAVDHQLIMITANDYDLGLFNGDTGVIMSDPATGNLRAWFTAPAGGELRSFTPSMLPAFEPAFAMTVHKSQGSEFDTVALVLPPNPELPVLTRELLYTGITRAKKKLAIWSEQVTFEKSITRQARSGSTLFYSYTEIFQPGI
jgi:exodeoxyribonuclease V alpha subunit